VTVKKEKEEILKVIQSARNLEIYIGPGGERERDETARWAADVRFFQWTDRQEKKGL
jgi:hypothetical protein